MNITSKLYILDQIYLIYEKFIAKLELACQKTCAHCCTNNVILTTLEGYKILSSLAAAPKSDLINKIRTKPDAKRFQPKITTNQLAQRCAEGIDPPDENHVTEGDACSLLTNKLCPIYALRPFGCRCLVSRHHCGEKGYAEVSDLVLSVNTVFLQTIEHLDRLGCSGNLVDVLGVLSSEAKRRAYQNNALKCEADGLISNHPLKILMIPPEHRPSIEPILQALRQVKNPDPEDPALNAPLQGAC